MTETNHPHPHLAPLRTRLAVFIVLAAIACAAIWLIDRRAMQRMHEYRQQQQQQPQAPADHHTTPTATL